MGGDDPPPCKGLFDHTKNRGGLFIIINPLVLESQEEVKEPTENRRADPAPIIP